jgi:hypothetical protein
VYKLGMKKRSVLILLEKPHTVEHVVSKSVFPPAEIILEIQALAQDGFIALSREAAPAVAAVEPLSGTSFLLKDEIVLSEAKFLMIDFWVDNFGTESEEFTEEINACGSVRDLSACLKSIVAAAQRQCPERLPVLSNLVKEINETA